MTTTSPARSRQPRARSTDEPIEIVRVSVPKRTLRSELRAIKIVWRRELIRFSNDRMRIVTSLVQPFLFLFVLGAGLADAWPAPAPTAST